MAAGHTLLNGGARAHLGRRCDLLCVIDQKAELVMATAAAEVVRRRAQKFGVHIRVATG